MPSNNAQKLLLLREQHLAAQAALKQEMAERNRLVARSPTKAPGASPKKAKQRPIQNPSPAKSPPSTAAANKKQPHILSTSIRAYRPDQDPDAAAVTPEQLQNASVSPDRYPQDTVARDIDNAIARSIADMLRTPEGAPTHPTTGTGPDNEDRAVSAMSLDDDSQLNIEPAKLETPAFMTAKTKPTYCELDDPSHTIPLAQNKGKKKKNGLFNKLFSCFGGGNMQMSPDRKRPGSASSDGNKPTPPLPQLTIGIAPLRQGSAFLDLSKPPSPLQETDVDQLRRSLARTVAEAVAANPPTARFGGRPNMSDDGTGDLPLCVQASQGVREGENGRYGSGGCDGGSEYGSNMQPSSNHFMAQHGGYVNKSESIIHRHQQQQRQQHRASPRRNLICSLPGAAPPHMVQQHPQQQHQHNQSRPQPHQQQLHVRQTEVSLFALLSQGAGPNPNPNAPPQSVGTMQNVGSAAGQGQGRMRAQRQLYSRDTKSAPSSPGSHTQRVRGPQSGASTKPAGVVAASPLKKPAIEPRMTKAAMARNQATQKRINEEKQKDAAHWTALPAAVKRAKGTSPLKRGDQMASAASNVNDKRKGPLRSHFSMEPQKKYSSCPSSPTGSRDIAHRNNPPQPEDNYMQMLERLQMGMSVDSTIIRAVKQPSPSIAVVPLSPAKEAGVPPGASPNTSSSTSSAVLAANAAAEAAITKSNDSGAIVYALKPAVGGRKKAHVAPVAASGFGPLLSQREVNPEAMDETNSQHSGEMAREKMVSIHDAVAAAAGSNLRQSVESSGESGVSGVLNRTGTLLEQLLDMQRSLTLDDLQKLRSTIRQGAEKLSKGN